MWMSMLRIQNACASLLQLPFVSSGILSALKMGIKNAPHRLTDKE
jgi:hypothetical protein